MTDIYGIPNCDTCRKARKWFDKQKIDHTFHDVRATGLTATQVKGWLKSVEDNKLVNTRSTTWRQLSDKERDKLGIATTELLIAHPTLLKRPLVISGKNCTVGYDEDSWKKIFK
ncbi:MAG: arsenate reductase family protein [Gammaproteobacteria bacterium]